MRRLPSLLPTVLAATLAAAVTTGIALGNGGGDDGDKGRAAYTIGLWGDVPYSADQVAVGVPNLIADMNDAKLAFSVHVGDIKAGGDRCDDPVYAQFESFLEQPACARVLHAGRQRVDGLRPSEQRAVRLRRAARLYPGELLRHALLARQEEDSRRRSGGALRREPSLEQGEGDLRHPARRRNEQQPLRRHRSRPGRVGGAQRGDQPLAAGDLCGGEAAQFGRRAARDPGKSRLRRCRPDAIAEPRPADTRPGRRLLHASFASSEPRRSRSGSRSCSRTGTRTTSGSTSRCRTRSETASSTSPASRRRATTPSPAATSPVGERRRRSARPRGVLVQARGRGGESADVSAVDDR